MLQWTRWSLNIHKILTFSVNVKAYPIVPDMPLDAFFLYSLRAFFFFFSLVFQCSYVFYLDFAALLWEVNKKLNNTEIIQIWIC